MRRTILVASLLAVAAVAHAAPSTTSTQPPTTSLDKSRVDAASKAHAAFELQYKSGIGTAEQVYQWSRRWCEAEGCATKPALEAHFVRMKNLETLVGTKVNAGLANGAEKLAAEFYRVEADLWVQRGKGP